MISKKPFNVRILIVCAIVFIALNIPGCSDEPAQEKSNPASQNSQTNSSQANAAMYYWQANAMFPEITYKQWEMIRSGYDRPVDDEIKKIVYEAIESTTLLHRATPMSRCDWQLDLRGWEGDFEYLGKFRKLTYVCCWRSRIYLEAGMQKQAVEEVRAILTLARRMHLLKHTINSMAADTIEHIMIDYMATFVDQFNEQSLSEFETLWSQLPEKASFKDMIIDERDMYLKPSLERLKKGDNQPALQIIGFTRAMDNWLKPLAELAEVESPYPDIHTEDWMTNDNYIKAFETAINYNNEVVEVLPANYQDFQKKHGQIYDRYKPVVEEIPMLSMMIGFYGHMAHDKVKMDVLLDLLKAGIDVQLHGPQAIKKHHDPITGVVFEYQQLDGGFKLISTTTWSYNSPDDDYPDEDCIELTFGEPARQPEPDYDDEELTTSDTSP